MQSFYAVWKSVKFDVSVFQILIDGENMRMDHFNIIFIIKLSEYCILSFLLGVLPFSLATSLCASSFMSILGFIPSSFSFVLLSFFCCFLQSYFPLFPFFLTFCPLSPPVFPSFFSCFLSSLPLLVFLLHPLCPLFQPPLLLSVFHYVLSSLSYINHLLSVMDDDQILRNA